MTKASSMAALIGVWTAGLLAASAAYSIHRPLVVPPAVDRVSRVVSEVQPRLPEDPTAIAEEEIMMMPEDTIVATVPRVVPAPVRAALVCKDWVDLAQGPLGSRVRYCE
jgi:hypothetical protein